MSSKSIKAFAPASISCFFKAHNHKNTRWAGSYGVGFTVDKGVITTISKYSSSERSESRSSRDSSRPIRQTQGRQARTIPHEILFNNKPINFPTVMSVLAILGVQPLKVEIESDLPLGCGFGLSGASALATAYAVNELHGLKKTRKELAIIAHTAEVENKTGLGDVVNQYFGGFFLKSKPSSHFVAQRIPLTTTSVYCKYFSKLSTKSVLTDESMKEKIEKAGSHGLSVMDKLLGERKKIKLADVIAVAKKFVVGSGLLQHARTKKLIETIERNGGNASMIILGNAVFSDIDFPGAIKLRISDKGAHLL